MVMASVKSFHGKGTQHRFLPDAVNQIQDDDSESTDIIIIGPPTGGQDSSLENEDNETLNTTGLPKEIAGKVKFFNIRNDEIEIMTSDGEESDVEPPLAKKQKQNPRKM